MVHKLNSEQVSLLIQEFEQVIESKRYQILSDSESPEDLHEDKSDINPEISNKTQF
jgi:uncharacterized protein (DUF2344 family)